MATSPHNIPLPDQWEEPTDAPAGMTDDDLLSLLKREQDAAVSYRNGTLADEQANALEFYDARPFGDEVDGQSQVVTPDVAEVVDYMTIAIAEACASGNIVKFKPKVTQLDGIKQATEYAQEATEAVKEAFLDEQDGFGVLIGWSQSGLIEKIGFVETKCVIERRNIRKTVKVDADQLVMLDADGVLLDATDNGDGTFTARTQQRVEVKTYPDETVPNEEMLFAARTRHEDATSYIARRSRVTRSSLVAQGFDRDTVEALEPDHGGEAWWNEAQASVRWGSEQDADRTGPMSEVILYQEYIRVDRDGDGIAELLEVFRVGDVILAAEEVDEQPFVSFCPFPRAHRMVGDAAAEKVMDLQRIRSVAARQTIDGVMLSNRPRAQIDENSIGDTTIDDWLTPGPGVLIRTRAGGEVKPVVEGFDIKQGLSLMQFLIGERESRTGITRLNQGLKSDALNIETATAFAGLKEQGQRMERYIARNFGNSVARLFRKKVRRMIAEGDPRMVQIDGQYRQADPNNWHGDMPVKVMIGVGSEDEEVELQRFQLLVQDQVNLRAMGSPLVTDENMYRARDGAVRVMGIGNPNEFYTDPSTQPPQEPKKDPATIEAEGKVQLEAAKLQGEQQKAAAELSLAQQKQEAALSIEADKAAMQAGIQQDKAALEAQLARDKADFEARLAAEKWAFEQEMARQRFEHDREMAQRKAEADAELPKNRPGGDLDK